MVRTGCANSVLEALTSVALWDGRFMPRAAVSKWLLEARLRKNDLDVEPSRRSSPNKDVTWKSPPRWQRPLRTAVEFKTVQDTQREEDLLGPLTVDARLRLISK
jgi:hypothetical protein